VKRRRTSAYERGAATEGKRPRTRAVRACTLTPQDGAAYGRTGESSQSTLQKAEPKLDAIRR
jgi:hypothetical protein